MSRLRCLLKVHKEIILILSKATSETIEGKTFILAYYSYKLGFSFKSVLYFTEVAASLFDLINTVI